MNNNFFRQEDMENLKEGEDMFVQLMHTALGGKNSDFDFIKSWQDRCLVKDYIKGVLTVTNVFDNLYKTTYQTYLDQIDSNTQDLGVVIAIKQFKQCRDYYYKELEIAYEMLNEYKVYILNGHLMDMLCGNIRKEEDLVDYRDVPNRWF